MQNEDRMQHHTNYDFLALCEFEFAVAQHGRRFGGATQHHLRPLETLHQRDLWHMRERGSRDTEKAY